MKYSISIAVVMCRLSVTARRTMKAVLPTQGGKEKVGKLVLLTFTLVVFTHGLTINNVGHPDIVAKTRVELRPITVNAFLYDIIRITAPVINAKAIYYIHKPNGDAIKLDLGTPKLKHIDRDIQPIVARFRKHIKPIIYQENNYDVYSFLTEEKLKKVEDNEFMIGPLLAEDHGNWVLSMYTKDLNDEWIEMFQVISVMILKFVPLTVSKMSPNLSVSEIIPIDSKLTLLVGDTLHASLAYPIPDLETCELVAPRSTFDRFFDRNHIEISTCGFSIPNITAEDAGTWKIVAVGKIVYEGEMTLDIVGNSTVTQIVVDY